MLVAQIELYNILKTKFTEKEAETIVASIEQRVHNSFDERKNDFATKEDLAKLEIKFTEKFGETNRRIAETKAEIIKWMFIFWIGQVASVIAIVKLMTH